MSGLDGLLQRRPPTNWDRFRSSPLLFLAQKVWAWTQSQPLRPASAVSPIKIPIRVVCISDTHNTHLAQPDLPAGDILIHSGDLTQSGSLAELRAALDWLNAQPHPNKVFIAGNHDTALAHPTMRKTIVESYPGLVYLEDSRVELTVHGRMLCLYGSPHTPKHGSWVFQYPRVPSQMAYTPEMHSETQATQVWSSIPSVTDILITHGPPFCHRDLNHAGCVALLVALWRVRPRLYVFGHIHAARGVEYLAWDHAQRLYEDVCLGKAGWTGLMRLVIWVVAGKLKRLSSGRSEQSTVLVNAAAVGGLKDEQKRGAIVVDI